MAMTEWMAGHFRWWTEIATPWLLSDAGGTWAAAIVGTVLAWRQIGIARKQTAIADKQTTIQERMEKWQKDQSEAQEKVEAARAEIQFFNVASERLMRTHAATYEQSMSEDSVRRNYEAFLDTCDYFLFLRDAKIITSVDLLKYLDTFKSRANGCSNVLLSYGHPHHSSRAKQWHSAV